MAMLFQSNPLFILFFASEIWVIGNYWRKVCDMVKNKILAVVLLIICFAIHIGIVYFIGRVVGTVVPFIMTLGVAMVASPGAPGGSIMTALPFLYMVFGAEAGDPDGAICAIMVALYITQDSFGTACNVSGDNAIGVIVDTIYKKFIVKTPQEN